MAYSTKFTGTCGTPAIRATPLDSDLLPGDTPLADMDKNSPKVNAVLLPSVPFPALCCMAMRSKPHEDYKNKSAARQDCNNESVVRQRVLLPLYENIQL